MRLAWLSLSILLAAILAGCGTTSTSDGGETPKLSADVRLPAIFTDHMVLQRDQKVPVWGWAGPGDTITVEINGQRTNARADRDGSWRASLSPMPAGGPHTLTVTGRNTITLNDVLVGEVWLASGQSNMWWPVMAGEYGVKDRKAEVAAANHPNLRFFTVPAATSLAPKIDCDATGWVACSPESVAGFSAVAYFFGRDLHQATGVPVGLIHSSWGGTVCEAWTSEGALKKLPDFAPLIQRMKDEAPNIEKAEADYQQAMAAWTAQLAGYDQGHEGEVPIWAARELDTTEWRTAQLPGLWENAGYPDLDGYMWYRKVLELPEDWAGKDLTLSLGPINDMDRTYFNGTLVGSHEGQTYASVPRTYSVPGSLVVPHVNVVAVRVYDQANVGGIHGNEDQLYVTLAGVADAPVIPLAGVWQNRPGAYLRDVPAAPEPPVLRSGDPNVPTVLYNAMIAPIVPYGIQGAIWYQGESNASRAYQYRTLFPAMISDWRAQWDQGDFPFLFVQLANFMKREDRPVESAWAELREAQAMTLDLPNTGMAVAIDIGEADDIHPQNKQEVGRRLSLWARHLAGGEQLVYSGPLYRAHQIEGNTIRIQFDHTAGGLKTLDQAPVTGFAIAGQDVVVSSPAVPQPTAVRYSWGDNPDCNLYNAANLPASPFRTDTWPGMTSGNK
jgi:sialate O-acetylesterase